MRKLLLCTILLCAVALLASGLTAAWAMGGGGCGGGGCGGGGGDGVIDPAPGAPFADPPDLPNECMMPGMVEVTLTPRISAVNVNGVMANLMTYNGDHPGGTIRVRQGDMLSIHFRNWLPATTATNMLGFTRNITNLHTHGLHVSPEPPADDAHIAIAPGAGYDYEYDLMCQPPGSMCFYHSHSHGLVAEQHWAGLSGAIVVEDPTPALAGYETHLMILKDISLVGSEPAPHTSTMDYMHGLEGNTVMVNGRVNPVLSIRPGQVQRWRILNASNARFYKLSLEGHSLYVVGTDGGWLDRPYAQSYVVLSPGERLDVLVKANTTKKNYRLLSLPYSRMGMMTSAQITMLTMACSGAALNQRLPGQFNPAAQRIDPNSLMIADTKTFTLGMSMGRGYINGHDFDADPLMVMSTLGTYEIWDIVNQTNMDHPWHQHVNAAQVLSITGGDAAYRTLYTTTPAWKDVVIVPKGGRVRLLVPVMDWPGMTMYHCHILEHEDIGMMGMWHIMGGGMPM